jgi:hypothetical protein
MTGARTILNPDFADVIAEKLGEFRRRIVKAEDEATPDIDPQDLLPVTKARIEAAEELLQKGSFDSDDLQKRLSAKFGAEAASTAIEDIAGYNIGYNLDGLMDNELPEPMRGESKAAFTPPPPSSADTADDYTHHTYKYGRNGVITQNQEYSDLLNGKSVTPVENEIATFDYAGKVQLNDGEVVYKDSMRTHGILKTHAHKGIYIGIDGITDYSNNRKMQGPEDVGEYDIYINIPSELQKEKNCYVELDSCRAASEFQGDPEDLQSIRDSEDYLVIRTGLDPKDDPKAREKIEIINKSIVNHIMKGGKLEEISELVYQETERLKEDDTPPAAGSFADRVLQQSRRSGSDSGGRGRS